MQSFRRVAHLTTVHGRYDIRIFRKECVSLAEHGWDTHLVVADGQGDERSSGVTVHDVGKPGSRFGRMAFAPWRAFRKALLLQADIYHFHDPELIPAALLLRWRGKTVVYDVHEDVPRQIMTKYWIRPLFRSSIAYIFEMLEDFAAKRFSAIVTATPHIAERFLQVNRRSTPVNNFPLREEIQLGQTTSVRMQDRDRNICYAGGITRIRGAIQMIRAMEEVDGKLILAGPMQNASFESELRALPGWSKVDYRGEVSRAGVRQIFNESRLGILPFLPAPNHLSAQPNKMFEYMSAGLPFVASDFPLWRSILVESNIALVANPEDPSALAAAIRELLDDPQRCQAMGASGLRMVSSSYNWTAQEKVLLDLYARLARPAGSADAPG